MNASNITSVNDTAKMTKRTWRRVFVLLAFHVSLSALLFSCKEDNAASVPFGTDETELCFQADGGAVSIHLTAGDDWTVTSDREWCLVSPTNGKASTECEIRVDSSYLYSAREAHLNFHCGTETRQITISQLGYEKVIKLDKTEIEVPDFTDYEALFEEIKVHANVDYDVEVEYADPERTGWLKATKVEQGKVQSIPRPGKVRLDYQMYLQSDADRLATVIFKAKESSLSANAEGEGSLLPEARLTFRQTKAVEIIPSREGDSLALLALSRIMHLSSNWDSSQPILLWNNVKTQTMTYFNTKLGREVTEPRVVGASFTMFETNEGIPFHIRYLDQLRELTFIANGNAHIKRIELGEHVTYLEHLKYLTLLGYGISSLPERMKEMKNLEELDLSGNNFLEIPIDIIKALDAQSLKYINLANNRRRDVFGNLQANSAVRDTLGIHGYLPEELFQLKNVRYLGLSYNYLEGSVPDMGYDASAFATLEEKIKNNPVMPQLEQLSINLNFMTGSLPDWILYHPNLRCWDPYTLVFNQYEKSRDSQGRNTGFDNEPGSIEQPCTLWNSDENDSYDNESDGSAYSRDNTFDPTIKYHTWVGTERR